MPAASTPEEVGAVIRAARRARGLTQRQLAERAGVGRQWLVALERGHDRAELGKVLDVLRALGLGLVTTEHPADADPGGAWLTAAAAAEAIREELARGDRDFAFRLLARAIADFRDRTEPDDLRRFLAPPASTGDHRWDTLLAAAVSRECRRRDLTAPAWTHVPPLRSWWFPDDDPLLTARTMQRTPIDLQVKGIWLDAKALDAL